MCSELWPNVLSSAASCWIAPCCMCQVKITTPAPSLQPMPVYQHAAAFEVIYSLLQEQTGPSQSLLLPSSPCLLLLAAQPVRGRSFHEWFLYKRLQGNSLTDYFPSFLLLFVLSKKPIFPKSLSESFFIQHDGRPDRVLPARVCPW